MGDVTGNLVAGSVRFRRPLSTMFLGYVAMGSGFFLLALVGLAPARSAALLPAMMLGGLLAGLGGPFFFVPMITRMQTIFHGHDIARVFRLRLVVMAAGMLVASLLATWCFELARRRRHPARLRAPDPGDRRRGLYSVPAHREPRSRRPRRARPGAGRLSRDSSCGKQCVLIASDRVHSVTVNLRKQERAMAKAFPTDNPFLRGYYGPVNTEADAGHLQITGEMPKELCGTLYRNGPNPQFAPRGPYHWFGGDGMIHAFHIENGNVSYKNRWVRTPKWEIENKEGEGLSGTFGNPRYTDPRVMALNSTIANTNIVWHGGKLLALEEAHAPFALDPASLMPKGYETFGDKLCGPFTAHPKIDPKTGEMVFFGYSAKGRFTKEVSIQTVTADGKVTRAEILEGPFPSMIHDFAVTRNWIVVPIFPLTSSMERAMARQAALRLGARQGHAHRLHPAQRHRRRRQVGDGAGLLRLPSDESFRDRRRQDRDRRDEIRRRAALPAARRLAVDQGARRRRGCSAGPSTSRARPTPSRRSSSTIAPASSRASTSASA